MAEVVNVLPVPGRYKKKPKAGTGIFTMAYTNSVRWKSLYRAFFFQEE